MSTVPCAVSTIDLDLGLLGADPAQQRHAVEPGHAEIGDQEIEALPREAVGRVGAVDRLGHHMALLGEGVREEFPQALLVVGYQNPGHG